MPEPLKNRTNDHLPVVIFSLVTLVFSVGVLLLPLPTLAGPALVVFIPTLVAAILLALSEGRRQVRLQLFGRAWRIDLRWAAISLGLALALRLGVSGLAGLLSPGVPFRPGPFSPFLLIPFLFAAGEEIGWRGYALPRLLARFSPLTAALILGFPWALLHLPLTLPGKLSAGTPPAAQLLTLLSLSVLLTWVYLGAGRSLLAATLLHGGQNALAVLNNGLLAGAASWSMAIVYAAAALLVVGVTRTMWARDHRHAPTPVITR